MSKALEVRTPVSIDEPQEVSPPDSPPPEVPLEPSASDDTEKMSQDQEVALKLDPKTMEFEELYYNKTTQKCAYKMFAKEKAKVLGRVKKERRKLRSYDSHGGSSTCTVSEAGAEEKSEAEVAGEAMVHELLNRYEINKKQDKLKGKTVVKEESEKKTGLLDSFEFMEDEEALWDDDLEPNSNKKPDFLKYTVPQYEEKLKLYNMHKETIINLTGTEIGKLINDVIPDLRDILTETKTSSRHEEFKKCGLNKQSLRDMTVGHPFDSDQEYQVMNAIHEALFSEMDPMDVTGEMLHYVTSVLVPEALIRIFATANNIPVELAEKELRYEAGYNGTLSNEILSTIKDQERSDKENID